MTDPFCAMGIGAAVVVGAIYAREEVRAWRRLNIVLEMQSDYLEEYIKGNEFSRKKSHEIDYELRERLEGAIKGMNEVFCMPYTFAKRTKVKGYLNQFLVEERRVEMKDARTIAEEFKKAVKGKSHEINKQSTGGL